MPCYNQMQPCLVTTLSQPLPFVLVVQQLEGTLLWAVAEIILSHMQLRNMLRLSQYMNSVLDDSMMDIQFHLAPLCMQVSYSTVLDQM